MNNCIRLKKKKFQLDKCRLEKGHCNETRPDNNRQCFRTCLRFMSLKDTLPQHSHISHLQNFNQASHELFFLYLL